MNSEEIIAAQQKMIDQLAAMLQWYVDEDEIHEHDPDNQCWVDGKHAAIKLLESLQ
jgi:hypothetical protein